MPDRRRDRFSAMPVPPAKGRDRLSVTPNPPPTTPTKGHDRFSVRQSPRGAAAAYYKQQRALGTGLPNLARVRGCPHFSLRRALYHFLGFRPGLPSLAFGPGCPASKALKVLLSFKSRLILGNLIRLYCRLWPPPVNIARARGITYLRSRKRSSCRENASALEKTAIALNRRPCTAIVLNRRPCCAERPDRNPNLNRAWGRFGALRGPLPAARCREEMLLCEVQRDQPCPHQQKHVERL